MTEPTTPGELERLVAELNASATSSSLTYGFDQSHYLSGRAAEAITSLQSQVLRLEGEKTWAVSVLRSRGVCMTCWNGPPEHYGCSDCLNTGWEQGAPLEARDAIARAETAQQALEGMRRLVASFCDEFGGTLDEYHKNGPHFTFKDGTEVFDVAVILDRADLITEARQALSPSPTDSGDK